MPDNAVQQKLSRRLLREIAAIIFTTSLLLGCVAAPGHDLPPCGNRQSGINHVRLVLAPGVFPPREIEIMRIGEGAAARFEVKGIVMPLGLGPARDLDARQLAEALAKRMGRCPIIEVLGSVSILGEVARPGDYRYIDGMTVNTAVAMADGFTPRAQQNGVWIKRRVDGEDCAADGGAPDSPLFPGDILNVPRKL